jgi:hypothetical protein
MSYCACIFREFLRHGAALPAASGLTLSVSGDTWSPEVKVKALDTLPETVVMIQGREENGYLRTPHGVDLLRAKADEWEWLAGQQRLTSPDVTSTLSNNSSG